MSTISEHNTQKQYTRRVCFRSQWTRKNVELSALPRAKKYESLICVSALATPFIFGFISAVAIYSVCSSERSTVIDVNRTNQPEHRALLAALS